MDDAMAARALVFDRSLGALLLLSLMPLARDDPRARTSCLIPNPLAFALSVEACARGGPAYPDFAIIFWSRPEMAYARYNPAVVAACYRTRCRNNRHHRVVVPKH